MLKKLMKIMMGVVLCAGLFMAMPKSAEAAQRTTQLNLTSPVVNPGNEGWTWDAVHNVLTLDNVDFDIPGASAIKVPGGSQIIFNGDNNNLRGNYRAIDCPGTLTLTVNGKANIYGSAYTIYSTGDLTINGNGTLNVNNGSYNYFGINSKEGCININAGIIKVEGGASTFIAFWAQQAINIDYVHFMEIKTNHYAFFSNGSVSINNPNALIYYGTDENTLDVDGSLCSTLSLTTSDYRKPYWKIEMEERSGSSSSKEKAKKESPTQKFTNNAVKTAKASGTVDATGGWKSFDRGTLKELSKAERDITIYFDHDTHVYSVTVPKGFDPEKLLNEEGYCGFQYLVKVYGAKVVGRSAK